MTHAAPQLTPSQLIDAGRRAEAEGRPDLAARFYCHLIEHFAEAAEAAEAQDALGCIKFQHPEAPAGPHAAVPRDQRRPLQPERDRYATGRVLARALGVAGWALALTGPAGLPAYILIHADAALSHAELLPVAGGAAGSLILGFGVVLAAQIAHAQFDQADAARDLVALERARLGLDSRS